jgi:hypothetical protein
MASNESDDSYLGKSASAGRMGKAVEYLVAAACILTTRGELNVSTSMVDDEGVDLVFHRRDSSATLAVQVKARMSDSVNVQRGQMLAFVRSQTFRPRADLDMLFVAVDVEQGAVLKAWLVPSGEFATALFGKTDARGRVRFVASMNEASKDRWAHRRLEPNELASAILARLESRPAASSRPQRSQASGSLGARWPDEALATGWGHHRASHRTHASAALRAEAGRRSCGERALP